jgi:hypothetical protein
MIGLKTYLPEIAPLLGMSAEMAYERQRALVREGLLKPRPGRGPGSGVTADEDSLAVLLISILSHDLLIEAPVTKFYCELRSAQNKCPITGARTFRKALSTLLANPALLEEHESGVVEVIRGSEPQADVGFYYDHTSTFVPEKKWKPEPELLASRVFRSVRIGLVDLLLPLSKDIAQFKKDVAT